MREMAAIVRGRVQGVWFRGWTRETARAIGATGWVRNLPDGTVEILAHGTDAQLDQLEAALWQGPPLARVTAIESRRADTDAPLPDFSVRR
ncbi:Acylphosphatase [Pseudodesulfovibrio hydrargyri]|uniref:Acylphosphatase n=1 Tax=Pseudodesulfovibrio hydrargyri TaxID=2125990 RepID=A0A1J5MRV8_9BACT|nr:acylphosphatase [Pseudodesulfovibrio hydrargyri]OIQ49334.1 Acylphosphatase [Pseudodesulfovibrio hydrargyri]